MGRIGDKSHGKIGTTGDQEDKHDGVAEQARRGGGACMTEQSTAGRNHENEAATDLLCRIIVQVNTH